MTNEGLDVYLNLHNADHLLECKLSLKKFIFSSFLCRDI